MSIYTKAFWKDAGERAFWTFLQVLSALLVTYVAAGQGFLDLEWGNTLSVVGLATLFAVIKALLAAKVNPETGASTGTAIPKGAVAAVEEAETVGAYSAQEAAPYPEGTPVDIVLDHDHRP